MGVPLRNIYGSTEVGLLSAHQRRAYDPETIGQLAADPTPSSGAPLESRITDDGELLVRGGAGFAGYYKNDRKRPPRSSSDGWYRTATRSTSTDSGSSSISTASRTCAACRRGHRYPPQFIENRLRFSPFIKDAMTFGDERQALRRRA